MQKTPTKVNGVSMPSRSRKIPFNTPKVKRCIEDSQYTNSIEVVNVLDAHAAGETEPVSITKIGPDLVFGRLWQKMGMGEIIGKLASVRRHGFDLERAVYLSVLHRLFVSGSDRAAEA